MVHNMLSQYIDKKLKNATYKTLKDGNYFGEVPEISGVWASAKNLEDCRTELKEVLEDWLLLKVHYQEKVPGFKIRLDKRELVGHA
jgi:predicted RNase H-like HicB family nuclease